MRLTGSVTVNGVRVGLNWSITGKNVISGPGLSGEDVKVHVSLPSYTDDSGSVKDEIETTENPTGGYWDMTVTDLRLALKERGLPIYGNKQDLITRLESADGETVEEEEVAEEVGEDAGE